MKCISFSINAMKDFITLYPRCNINATAYNGGLGAEPRVRWLGAKPPEAEDLLAFQRSVKSAKFNPSTVSGQLNVGHVSAALNRIPNTPLMRTGRLNQLRETAQSPDSGESEISRIINCMTDY